MASKPPQWLVNLEDLAKESKQADKASQEKPQTSKRPSVSVKQPTGLAERKASEEQQPPGAPARRRCLSEANTTYDQETPVSNQAPRANPSQPSIQTRPRGARVEVEPAASEPPTEPAAPSKPPRPMLAVEPKTVESPEAVAAPPVQAKPRRATLSEVTQPPDEPQEPKLDQAKVDGLMAELRARQNFAMGAVAGALAAVVGALVWAVITVATGYQIGWMAVGIGFLVGGMVRTLGQGIDKSFGRLGAGLALFGCVLGNFFSVCALVAQEAGISATTVLTQINPAAVPELMIATFHPMDILFYAIAIYEGYRFSFRKITPEDVSRVVD